MRQSVIDVPLNWFVCGRALALPSPSTWFDFAGREPESSMEQTRVSVAGESREWLPGFAPGGRRVAAATELRAPQ